MKINEALVAVMEEVGAVNKGGHNTAQKFRFRGIDQVVNAVAPALKANGVVVRPIDSEVTYTERTNRNGNAVIDARARVTYQWVGPEGDYFNTTVCSEGRDTADKATAKAMSVAFRTCILQTLALPTDEPDPDEDYDEVPGRGRGSSTPPVDHDMLKVVLGAIQTDAKAANVPDERMAELAAEAGVRGRISACKDVAALQKLSDLVRLENG